MTFGVSVYTPGMGTSVLSGELSQNRSTERLVEGETK